MLDRHCARCCVLRSVGASGENRSSNAYNVKLPSRERRPQIRFSGRGGTSKGNRAHKGGFVCPGNSAFACGTGTSSSNEYAAKFNLSLSLVAIGQPKLAIPILSSLRDAGHDNVDVNNLLAQAYVGDGQNQKAMEALRKAAKLAPENEKAVPICGRRMHGKATIRGGPGSGGLGTGSFA